VLERASIDSPLFGAQVYNVSHGLEGDLDDSYHRNGLMGFPGLKHKRVSTLLLER